MLHFRLVRNHIASLSLFCVLGCGATKAPSQTSTPQLEPKESTNTEAAHKDPSSKNNSSPIAKPATCPADVAPKQFRPSDFSLDNCRAERLSECTDACEKGVAIACYEAALELQTIPKRAGEAEPLFLRACALGIASGCTNHAASLFISDSSDLDCPIRTFRISCEVGHDPWGCAMLGLALTKASKQFPASTEEIREILSKACEYEKPHESEPEGGEACLAAKQIAATL